jgi:hypothetical protein
MSITKDDIATVLNARLVRAETATTLATQIKAGLAYLSERGRWPVLHSSSAVSLIAADSHIDYPTDLREIDKIILTDTTGSYDPLGKVDWEYILQCRTGTPGNTRPYNYCRRGAKLELDAACDKAYTATVYFWRYHPDQATILFGDEWAEALYNAVIYKYLEGKKQVDQAAYFRRIADLEIEKFRDTEDLISTQAKYRDI